MHTNYSHKPLHILKIILYLSSAENIENHTVVVRRIF